MFAAVLAPIFGALAIAVPTSAPTLRLVSLDPPTIRGQHFQPRETVLVTLRVGRQSAERAVRASSTGTFAVSFPRVSIGGCAGYVVRAIGSRGSTATLRSPPVLCPPRPSGVRVPG